MPAQAIVIIGIKQWTVSVASTPAELVAGLSGVASIPAGTGMLFNLGYDQNRIEINTAEMLFPMDIIFIGSNTGVRGVLVNIQPGEAAIFEATYTPGARYFLEVNAGEAEGIEVDDDVAIQGQVSPMFWPAFIVGALVAGLGLVATKEVVD